MPVPAGRRHDLPRERAARWGVEVLSDVELVSLLLATAGRSGSSVGDLARELFLEFGSVARLSTAAPADLRRLAGVGPAKAAMICAAFELGRRAADRQPDVVVLDASSAIAAAARPLLAGRRERLLVLSADNALRLHGVDMVSQGGAGATGAPVREILAAVLRRDCSAFALAHQHPGGNPTPSQRDVESTRRIRDAAGVTGLRMLDHVVLGDNRWASISSSTRTPD